MKQFFDEERKNDIFISFAIVSLFIVTVLILGPFEIVSANSKDLIFSVGDFWYINVVTSLLLCAFGTLVLVCLPNKIRNACLVLGFSVSVCLYVQANFLNGEMRSLQGQSDSFSRKTQVINLVVWFVIICVICIACFIKWGKLKKIVQGAAVFLCLIQLVTSVVLLINERSHTMEKQEYISSEYMTDLSDKKNVIVFILDTADGRIIDQLFEEKDFFKPLEGFTYYPNCTSMFSRTYPAVPYLLTGEKCYFDKTPEDFVNEAYTASDYWNKLVDNDVNIGLYTRIQFIGDSAKDSVVNYYNKEPQLSKTEILKQTLKMTLYRDMPYLCKARFHYEAADIANRVVVTSDQPKVYQYFKDEWVGNEITTEGVKINKECGDKTFRLIHFGAFHLGWSLDSLKEAYSYVFDYIEQMKQLGLYEDATILIVADHGFSGGGETLDMPQQTAVPLMMVKEAGESGAELRISEAPVSQTEFMPTILSAYGINDKNIDTFKDIENSNIERERLYYYSSLYSDDEGEIRLREYKVMGDARNPESYNYTGNSWEIMYSLNKVADESVKKQSEK